MAKTAGGATTHFVYGLGGELLAEVDAVAGTVRQYVYVEGALMAVVTPTGEYTVYGDHLGTPHRVVDGNANPVWEARYAPFGEADPLINAVDLPIRFPGQYHDAETGMHYNYFRDYDPSTGRYVQSDPVGLAGGPNTYAYVGGNPVALTDPQGLKIPDDLIVGCQGLGCRGSNTFSPDGPRCGGCEKPITITHTSGLPQARIRPDVTKTYSLDCLLSVGLVNAGTVGAGAVAQSAAAAAADYKGLTRTATVLRFVNHPVVTGMQLLFAGEGVLEQCECNPE